LALFSVIAIAAIVSGILLVPQLANATVNGDTMLTTQDSNATDAATQEANEIALSTWNNDCMGFGRRGMRFGMRGFGGFGPVEVSEEFEQTVTGIAESDTDIQNLIAEGYNFTLVRPIVKTVIDAEGNIVTKATTAVLTLQKDTTGHASVTVSIEESKVTQIVILTRTVIDKP
jgi:hypothetical protein